MELSAACVNHPDVVEGLRRCGRCGQLFCGDCLVVILNRDFCATCKTERMLDLISGVNPGELDLANIGRRFIALIIDGFVIAVPMLALFGLAAFFGTRAKNDPTEFLAFVMPLALLPAVLYIVYEGVMLGARGQTFGKMAMNIRVVRVDGSPISKGQAWGRSVMRAILASCLSLFNYVPALLTKDKTCLHDLVASTRVVNGD